MKTYQITALVRQQGTNVTKMIRFNGQAQTQKLVEQLAARKIKTDYKLTPEQLSNIRLLVKEAR